MITDEMITLLRDILKEMQEISWKLDDIKGSGAFNSISDVCDKLENLKDSVDGITSNGAYCLGDILDK